VAATGVVATGVAGTTDAVAGAVGTEVGAITTGVLAVAPGSRGAIDMSRCNNSASESDATDDGPDDGADAPPATGVGDGVIPATASASRSARNRALAIVTSVIPPSDDGSAAGLGYCVSFGANHFARTPLRGSTLGSTLPSPGTVG